MRHMVAMARGLIPAQSQGFAQMAYIRKTTDEYRLFGNYGHGWEEVCAESTRAEIKARYVEYRENETDVAHKWTGPHRVKTEGAVS